jgi:hypothetical protein
MNVYNGNLTNTSIIAVPGHGNVLRQVIQANAAGGGSGISVYANLPREVDEASIQYDIRFEDSFQWGWGGKLPGLGGVTAGTAQGSAGGCAAPNGNSWSGRGMWITPGSYGSVRGDNEWIGYMYNFHKVADCGDNVRTGKAFVLGAWHTVKQYYKMNTPGQSNGIHRMWMDGQLLVDNTAFQYRNTADLHINTIYWSIFRGGSTSDWSTSNPGPIDFDNLLITAS